MRPGWVVAGDGRDATTAAWDVTPHAQNTGTAPSAISTASATFPAGTGRIETPGAR